MAIKKAHSPVPGSGRRAQCQYAELKASTSSVPSPLAGSTGPTATARPTGLVCTLGRNALDGRRVEIHRPSAAFRTAAPDRLVFCHTRLVLRTAVAPSPWDGTRHPSHVQRLEAICRAVLPWTRFLSPSPWPGQRPGQGPGTEHTASAQDLPGAARSVWGRWTYIIVDYYG